MKPRVTWVVHVKVLVGTGIKTCTRFRLACEAPDPCTTIENCGAPVGGFWSGYGDSDTDADITCKVNRCIKS